MVETKLEDTGNKGSRVWNYDSRIFTFFHKHQGEFTGTQRQLIKTYGLSQSNVNQMINGKIHHSKGWYLNKSIMLSGSKAGKVNPSYNHKIYEFRNIDGEVFTGTQYDFRVKFALDFRSVSSIVRGKTKKHKGWSVL